jgi:nondiscriminating glutamyl-tRNA synthetase
MSSDIRVRFAPSPTGRLHIGTARTALFNWLFARHAGGKFILRIEDTDRDRSTEMFEGAILDDLAWLGLTWDEGPDTGGVFGPYRQTERLETGYYQRALDKLAAGAHVYECFCTPEELEAEREQALAAGEMPKYSGKCRNLKIERREELLAAGRRPTLRFAVPANRIISFEDIIRGHLEFSTDVIGDFIVSRESGVPTYNFAASVDDADMGITHVIRGEDHLTNTARQLLIFEALGVAPPLFAHLSMILGPDRAKLSKRHGATSVGEYREAGYLPEALVNNLALLSWSPEGGEEILDIEALTGEFSLERVAKSPPVFDGEKLKWFNAQHLRRLDPANLMELARPFLEPEWADVVNRKAGDRALFRVIEAMQTNMEVLTDITAFVKIFFTVEYDKEVLDRLATSPATGIIAAMAAALDALGPLSLEESKELIAQVKREMIDAGVKPKDIFQTLRLALTGRLSGPELFYLPYVLGPEECRRRLLSIGGQV